MKAYHATHYYTEAEGISVYVIVHGKDYVPFAKLWAPEDDPILNQDKYLLHQLRQGRFNRLGPDSDGREDYELGEFIWEASDED